VAGERWRQRRELLTQAFSEYDYPELPLPEALCGVPGHDPEALNPKELYRQLRQLNARWGCPFYEGVVSKRIADAYPVQLRSPNEAFVDWAKHRWAG
jgi:hypothetical protein